MAEINLLSECGVIDADTLSGTTTNASYPRYNVTDFNIHTQWRSVGTGTETLIADFGAGNTHSADCVAIHHELDVGSYMKIYYDDSGYQQIGSPQEITSNNSPILFWDLGATYTSRYFKLEFYNLSTVAKVNVWFLGTMETISLVYNYGNPHASPNYGVSQVESYGGVVRSVQKRESRKIWVVNWKALDSTNKGYLDTMMSNCGGGQYPMFFEDPDGDDHLVRVMTPSLNATEIAHTYFDVGTVLQEEL